MTRKYKVSSWYSKKAKRSYPIRAVPDNLFGVSYISGPRGWIDTTVMPQWLSGKKMIGPLPNRRKRVLYVDNCSGYNETTELTSALSKISIEI